MSSKFQRDYLLRKLLSFLSYAKFSFYYFYLFLWLLLLSVVVVVVVVNGIIYLWSEYGTCTLGNNMFILKLIRYNNENSFEKFKFNTSSKGNIKYEKQMRDIYIYI